MKLKYLVLFLTLAIAIVGCKSNDDGTVVEQIATVRDGANVAGFESCGWVIEFNNSFGSIVVPESIDPEFQQDQLEVLVIVTNSLELADCTSRSERKVRVVSIRAAN